MSRKAMLSGSKRILALCLLLAGMTCKPSTPPPAQPSAPTVASPSPATPVELKGTVRLVEPKSRTVDVITAVGHAARLVRFEVADTCKISIPAKSPRLESIEPGTTVRIAYITPQAAAQAVPRKVAVTIEALEIGGPGETR